MRRSGSFLSCAAASKGARGRCENLPAARWRGPAGAVLVAGVLALGFLALGLTDAEAQKPPAPLPQAGPVRSGPPNGIPRRLPRSVPLPPPRPPELVALDKVQEGPVQEGPVQEGPAQATAQGVPEQQAAVAPAPFAFPPLFGPPPEPSPEPSPAPAAEPEPSAPAVPLPPPPPGRRAPPEAGTPSAPSPSAAEAPKQDADVELPAACASLVAQGDISAAPVRDLEVKDGCSLPAPVSLSAVRLKDGRLLPLKPAAILRCEMVKAVADWVRDDLAPAVTALGKPVEAVRVAASFGCRPRNNVKGARVSEHGFGNAIDIGGFQTEGGGDLEVRNGGLSPDFQKRMKESACRRFTTVLGPGSDGYHEDHIHVDLAQRRGGYRLCRWIIKDKAPAVAAPLPQSKPSKTGASQAKAATVEPAARSGADKAGSKSGADKASAKSGAGKTGSKSGADKASAKSGAGKTGSKDAASDAKTGSKAGGG